MIFFLSWKREKTVYLATSFWVKGHCVVCICIKWQWTQILETSALNGLADEAESSEEIIFFIMLLFPCDMEASAPVLNIGTYTNVQIIFMSSNKILQMVIMLVWWWWLNNAAKYITTGREEKTKENWPIDDFQKQKGRKFSAIFPTVTELCHLIVGQTLLSHLCLMHTWIEVVCEKPYDLQAVCVCVCVTNTIFFQFLHLNVRHLSVCCSCSVS